MPVPKLSPNTATFDDGAAPRIKSNAAQASARSPSSLGLAYVKVGSSGLILREVERPECAKRALEMAAAGGHNLLMVEPIKPYPARQTAAEKWQSMSDLLFPGRTWLGR
jgi:hypothetical protein